MGKDAGETKSRAPLLQLWPPNQELAWMWHDLGSHAALKRCFWEESTESRSCKFWASGENFLQSFSLLYLVLESVQNLPEWGRSFKIWVMMIVFFSVLSWTKSLCIMPFNVWYGLFFSNCHSVGPFESLEDSLVKWKEAPKLTQKSWYWVFPYYVAWVLMTPLTSFVRWG